jgi:hypothetical protein
MSNLYRGPYIDAFCQVWFHLVQLFQRSRLKYEKLTDGRKKSSPLKLLGQMEPNLAGSIYVRSSIKLLHLIPFGQQTWPLLLKIEHGVKLHVFSNNSKTVNNIRKPYIDAFCQVWFHLVQLFQRSRLKYEKLTDGRRTDDGRQVMAIPHMTYVT